VTAITVEKGREGAIAERERSGLELVTFDLTVTAAAGSRTQPMNPTLRVQ
jgi:hypothetical protein